MPPPPDPLRFPAPSSGGPSTRESTIIDFLGAVAAWRRGVLDHLDAGAHSLTAKAARALSAELRGAEFPGATIAHTRTPRRSLVAVMKWRAGFHDYLSDVWDVIGEPALDMHECNALLDYLRPPGPPRCGLCLEQYPPDKMHVTNHGCPLFGYVTSSWLEAAKAAGLAPPDATSIEQLLEPVDD